MRDKYVEIIKEYIHEKPEYKTVLDELKATVLTIGATEEEFDEAIKQTTGLSKSSKLFLKDYSKNNLFKDFSKTHFRIRKTHAALLALLIVFGFGFNFLYTVKPNYKISVTQTAPAAENTKTVAIKIPGTAPIVYANSNPIDPDKIFSIKTTKTAPLIVTGKPKKEIMGFLPYWMLSQEDKINLDTLTSVSLFGLEINESGEIASVNSEQTEEGSIWTNSKTDGFIKRAKAQGLKVYLTLKSFNNTNIENLSKSDTAQKKMIENASYLVNSKNIDGINIDFEYVGNVSKETRDGFTRLITNLNAELKRQNPNTELSIDTYLTSGAEKQLFNLAALAKEVDSFVIMGYDMHTPNGSAGSLSAMGGETNIIGYVQNYLEQVDSSKLILAVPYYGYDWPNDVSSPSADMVKALPYAEIAEQSKDLKISWDETSQTPYFTYKDGDQTRTVHFDNVRSLGIKYDFINKKDLKGVGIWTLGYDGQNQDLEKLLIDKFINQ